MMSWYNGTSADTQRQHQKSKSGVFVRAISVEWTVDAEIKISSAEKIELYQVLSV